MGQTENNKGIEYDKHYQYLYITDDKGGRDTLILIRG